MNVYIPSLIRAEVKIRAKHACEYCLLHERLSFFVHEIDHIISIKHGFINDHEPWQILAQLKLDMIRRLLKRNLPKDQTL
jgi:5-methylcytosine-specific restriction endonuclease McrA